MFGLLALGIVGVLLWMFWSPHMGFAPGFASLLDRPVGAHGLFQFLRGEENVGGEYRGRPVLLLMHHKRGRHDIGYLVVAMKTTDAFTSRADSFRERIVDPEAKKAWDRLELDEELKLAYDGGWMKATWQPSGFTIFPGTFDPVKWKRVLNAMNTVAGAIN